MTTGGLGLLLPQPTISQVNLWATVTAVTPLRVQLDGEPGPLPITPDTLVGGLTAGDRVWVQLTTNSDPARRSRRLVVIGKAGGSDLPAVGDLHFSTASTNPSTRWPGTTWAQITDVFLLAAGSTYTAGATGGEAEHTLTVAEMPVHNHPAATGAFVGTGGGTYAVPNGTFYGFQDVASSNAGGGDPHNNMPPYLVVYVWKRTA